jgi:hypothetical protein
VWLGLEWLLSFAGICFSNCSAFHRYENWAQPGAVELERQSAHISLQIFIAKPIVNEVDWRLQRMQHTSFIFQQQLDWNSTSIHPNNQSEFHSKT